jgi:hypothetical protein
VFSTEFPFHYLVIVGAAIGAQGVCSLSVNAGDWLKILSTQKLHNNIVEVAVRYPHEPGYDLMRVVTINCSTKTLQGQYGRDMSPGLTKMIAQRVCGN